MLTRPRLQFLLQQSLQEEKAREEAEVKELEEKVDRMMQQLAEKAGEGFIPVFSSLLGSTVDTCMALVGVFLRPFVPGSYLFGARLA